MPTRGNIVPPPPPLLSPTTPSNVLPAKGPSRNVPKKTKHINFPSPTILLFLNHYLHSEPTKNLKILILSGF